MVFSRTADAHFNLYLALRNTVPLSSRPALEALRTGVGGSMDDLDLHILEMRTNASEYPASTVQRPGKSSTVAAQRQEEEEGLLLTGPLNPHPSVMVAMIQNLEPDWAMRYLPGLRDPAAGWQPYVHRLAVVARGGGAALLNTGHEVPSVRKSTDRGRLTSATVRGASTRNTYTWRHRTRTGGGRRAAGRSECGAGAGPCTTPAHMGPAAGGGRVCCRW
jgi:hypothetical protein